MKNITAARLPNLFDLILEQQHKFSINAFVLTYLILPFLIAIAVVSSGVVKPNGTPAALFLYLALIYSNGLIAAAIAVVAPKADRQKRTLLHLFVSVAFPFVFWRLWAFFAFGY